MAVLTNQSHVKKRSLLKRRYEFKQSGVLRDYDMQSPAAKTGAVVIGFICIAMMLIVLFPIIWVFLAGFKEIREFQRSFSIIPASFSLDIDLENWRLLKFGKYYVNSAVIALGGAVCAVVFNGIIAYVLGVIRPRGWRVIYGLVMWTLLIPPTTSIVAQVMNIKQAQNFFANLLSIKVNDSLLAIVPLWLIMGANAFWLVLFKNFFEALPKDYIEAAHIDGCTSFGIFFRIILPLSTPIVMVVVIYAITSAWSDFLLPYILLSGSNWKTVAIRLFQFRTENMINDVDRIHGGVFSIIPPIILFAIFQNQITKGIAAGGIKG
jgi:multiple sugar transport system permease protein